MAEVLVFRILFFLVLVFFSFARTFRFRVVEFVVHSRGVSSSSVDKFSFEGLYIPPPYMQTRLNYGQLWRSRRAVTTTKWFSTAATGTYHFTIGASFAGKSPRKGEKLVLPSERFPASSDINNWSKKQFGIKKRLAFNSAGEDAFFIQQMDHNSGVAVGVADGVGGWTENNIDPGVFSQALMYYAAHHCKLASANEDDITPFSDDEEVSSRHLSPERCLRLAYDAVLRDPLVEGGSSTGSVATFNTRSGILKAANLGDSGLMIIRNKTSFHIQKPQTHYFNCPRQLSKIPKRMRLSGFLADKPEDADLYSTTLRHADIAILYTDGVSDNVWPSELVAIATIVMRQGGTETEQAQNISDAIVEYARHSMNRVDRVTPFEEGSVEAGQPWYGGKVDDATAVVVLVSEGVHDPAAETPLI